MLQSRYLVSLFKRLKHSKTHWSKAQKKQFAKDRALENFDDFYGQVFGKRWKSMRVALLSEHKYMAIINQFGDTKETISQMQTDGAINLRDIYNAKKNYLINERTYTTVNTNSTKLDPLIQSITENKILCEKESIYQDGYECDTSEKVSYKDSKSSTSEHYVSLSKALKGDAKIELERLVNSNVGSSALHEFVPASKLKGMEDFVFESDHYKYYSDNNDFPLKIEMDTRFEIPENLDIFTFERGNITKFRSPRKSSTGALTHFLLDGASVLPPLLLDIQPGDRVLDACAAPGGKSLLLLQTLRPGTLVCNDVQESRINRIKSLMSSYVYNFNETTRLTNCVITRTDARNIEDFEMYDRILVDVPCTTDRHSVSENDNNIFNPSRVKERLRLPELQAGILANCLKLLKLGGTLVYSTCSLSPIQNDGVVHMALTNAFSDSGITVTVMDTNMVLQPFSDIYKFTHQNTLKYGQMVLPFLPVNFGPMYFCKLVRNT